MLTDGRTTDGRTPDASIYYKLTCEPTAQVSLKERHFHLLPKRISPAVVTVVATNSVRTILLSGPIFDLQIPTDRLVQHLALTHNIDAHISMKTGQLPDRVHPTGSETKYHVFNNQITDNVDIYHSEATTLIPKARTMKYTQNIRAHTVTTHIQSQNPEIIYEHLPYCSYQPYSFKCDKYISMVT